MAMKKRSRPAVRRKAPTRRAGHGGVGHIPLAEHKKEEARLNKLRQTVRSIETSFSPDALRTTKRRARSKAVSAAVEALPSVDFRERAQLAEVRKQPPGDRRCVGFALAGALECWLALNSPDAGSLTLSEQHVFELGQNKQTIGRAAKEVKKGVLEGACFGAQPPCVNAKTRTWRGTVEEVVKNQPADLCKLLNQNMPLVHEIRIAGNFDEFQGSGTYAPDDTPGGAHAMVIVGFEQDEEGGGAWIVMNSLGKGWGESGFGRIRWNDPFCRPEVVVFVVKGVTRAA